MIPIAGSAYTYGYATLGEFVAWIIGWDLILEYLFGAATVAVGWSRLLRRVPARSSAFTFRGVDAGAARRRRHAHLVATCCASTGTATRSPP